MNELSMFIEEKDGVETVDSRKIHAFLEVKEKHADWIKRKVEELAFIPGEDYFRETGNRSGPTKGRGKAVYYLTQRAAEHLGMAESGEKGKEIRDAFIAARNELKKRIRSEVKEKSTSTRKLLTSRWAEHGIGGNYGRATCKEYEVAFGDRKIRKPDMDETKLLALTIFEATESIKLDQSPRIQGIADIECSLVETGGALTEMFQRLRIRGPEVTA